MGWTREDHEDGSYTRRHEIADTSVTYDADDNVQEYSYSKSVFGTGRHIQITEDGDGNRINVQERED
jgi:hypothetical protein